MVERGNKLSKLKKTQFNLLAAPSQYKRHPFLFLIFFCGITILLFFGNMKNFIKAPTKPMWYKQHFAQKEESFAIRTEGCTIPGMKPLSEEVKPFVYYPRDMKPCLHAKHPLLINNETHIWTDNLEHYNVTEKKKFKCCYYSFYRPKAVSNVYSSSADERVKYNECINFVDIIEAKDEFVKVTCSYVGIDIYVQFFLFVVPKVIEKPAKSDNLTYNVVVLGIDAVSRLNLHRTMPKMISFLQKNGAVELMGYNKVGDNSFPNIVPILMGYNTTEIKRICHPFSHSHYDSCPFIWNLFKDLGYYTAFCEDSSFMGTFNYAQAGFIRTPTDYYIHTFIHEPRRMLDRDPGFTHQICMHDKYFYKVQLDYFETLAKLLQPNRFFGFFWEVTMTHDDINYPMAMDTHYVELLSKLEKSKYLDETVLIILSDHGMRWGEIRSTKQGRLEERLPFVFVLTPPSFRIQYKEAYNNLKLNGRRLTTPFDVHGMMVDLANMENIKDDAIISRSKESYGAQREISLFLPIPPNRTCEMAEISDHWCTCHSNIKMSTTDNIIMTAAQTLTKVLNEILKIYTQCEKLVLSDIVEANEITWESRKKDEHRDFMIVIRTLPGNGEFEATIRKNKDKWILVTLPSRLNLYGTQSHCMHNPQLKLYCYCKNQGS